MCAGECASAESGAAGDVSYGCVLLVACPPPRGDREGGGRGGEPGGGRGGSRQSAPPPHDSFRAQCRTCSCRPCSRRLCSSPAWRTRPVQSRGARSTLPSGSVLSARHLARVLGARAARPACAFGRRLSEGLGCGKSIPAPRTAHGSFRWAARDEPRSVTLAGRPRALGAEVRPCRPHVGRGGGADGEASATPWRRQVAPGRGRRPGSDKSAGCGGSSATARRRTRISAPASTSGTARL